MRFYRARPASHFGRKSLLGKTRVASLLGQVRVTLQLRLCWVRPALHFSRKNQLGKTRIAFLLGQARVTLQ